MDFSTQTSSPFNCILLDLDDTLYSGAIGFPRYMRQNIEDFLSKTCAISSSDACALRAEFFRTFGSSFIGLRARGYDIHPDVYHSFVHGRLPYDLITPDPCLRDTLRSIPQTKMLFTNSDRQHAKKVLERLGIEEKTFARIICFETMNPHLFSPTAADAVSLPSKPVVLKPSTTAMEVAIKIAGFDPRCMLFLDDNERNVAAGKALGLNTVLVGKAVESKEADYVLESIGSLRETVPEIWREAEVEMDVVEEKGHGAIVRVHDKTQRNDVDFSSPTTFVEA